ncbi:VOC family protein [Nocardioides alpinus]|jgi:predicted enzyme related to lactoylglutathione lyase|uniref:VOC family protein n=1 Tax=Nocardioides alpinus TaxID=748909 RepID=UPI0018E3375F
MRIHEFGHPLLYVRDLDRSRRFYRDVLGWNEIRGECHCRSPRRRSPPDAPTTSCC